MLAVLSSGHADLADWLLLVAFVVFVIAAVAATPIEPRLTRVPWLAIGLALLTLALFVT